MRLRHKAHGVIANVDDETGERLLGGPWERADAESDDVEYPEGAPEEEWTVKQLKAYAADRSIDLGDATKKADMVAAIAAAEESGD